MVSSRFLYYDIDEIFRKGELYLFENYIESNIELYILFINIQRKDFEKNTWNPKFL